MTDDYRAIDAVVNIWTEEALSVRPDWGPDFFVGKMKAQGGLMSGLTLEQMIARMDEAGIGHGFLIAAKAGRPGLPGCYHMPPEIVARAVEGYPDRFSGLIGIDPYTGMDGVRELEQAVTELGFIGAHLYPHWFELAPDHAKYYPFYAKCVELGVPIQMQVGQSMIYSTEFRCRSVGQPITLDAVACDFPELKIVGIHVGIPWTREMIAMAWKHDNVYIGADAHSPKYWPDEFVHYINTFGQDKVIFGTDFPVLDFARTRREIDDLGLRPGPKRKLLRENVIRVYGLDAGD
ncbi:MAG: amidohydrolase family protein [Gammaproteobacteria bacterium]